VGEGHIHPGDPHARRKVYIGLALAILLCSASQLCWKYATPEPEVAAGYSAGQTLASTLSRPSFWIAAGLYVWQFFNWMVVLKYADLSFAQPITAGTYVVVGFAARWLFNESVPPHRMLGLCLILAGVALISQSPHTSSSAAREPEPVKEAV
jgi:drug/metabolite transporter (DMT)-like permease